MKSLDPKSVAIGILSTLCIVLLIGAAGNKEKLIEAETIRAHKFQIVTPDGKVRGTFLATEKGDAMLTMGGIVENKFSVWATQREDPQGGNVVVKLETEEGEIRITGGPHGDEFGHLGPAIYMHTGQSDEKASDPTLVMLGIGKDPSAGFLCIKSQCLGEGGTPLNEVRGRSPIMIWGSKGLFWTAPPEMEPCGKSTSQGPVR